VIVFEDVSFTYALGGRTALRHVNLEIAEGEFVVLAGRSGSGKSTLLRCINGLVPHFYGGRLDGRVLVDGIDTRASPVREAARVVGMVFQDPENQFVTGSARAEISFGLENLGYDDREIGEKVAWIARRLGLESLLERSPLELSGGEKQKIIIASVLAMGTKVVVLDEPTSQLDPYSSSEILDLLSWIGEQGYTVVVSEHRLPRLLERASRVVALEDGRIAFDGEPSQFSNRFSTLVKLGDGFRAPVSRNVEARQRLSARGLAFRYPDGSDWVLDGLSLDLMKSEVLSIVGRNGSGKSTLAAVLAGILKPHSGEILLDGKDISSLPRLEASKRIGIVFQDPNVHLFHDTVEEEIWFARKNLGLEDDGWVRALVERMGLEGYMSSNPRDLSGGEREKVAIASVVSHQPEVLILDEPTRGLDLEEKRQLMSSLRQLAADSGLSVLLLSHDLEVVEAFSDRVGVLKAGKISYCGEPEEAIRRFWSK